MMFYISDVKKEEVWQALSSERLPARLTKKRLARLKSIVWDDADFWDDVVARHGLMELTIAELKEEDKATFTHCLGNFVGMLMQTLVESTRPSNQRLQPTTYQRADWDGLEGARRLNRATLDCSIESEAR